MLCSPHKGEVEGPRALHWLESHEATSVRVAVLASARERGLGSTGLGGKKQGWRWGGVNCHEAGLRTGRHYDKNSVCIRLAWSWPFLGSVPQ